MDHGASALNSTFWTFSSTTSLETANTANFLEPEPFMSSVLYDPSQYSPFRVETATSLVQSESFPLEGGKSGSRWLIDPSYSVKHRLMLAVQYLKEYVEDSDVLIQIWMPTKIGGQNVLSTIDQPYSLNPNCRSLASYRNVSKTFHLTVEENSKESAGLPGRVFLGKLPEWTPDVRFFRSDECPRKSYAKMYNISGCLALPVFEQDNGICLAVVEIVTTTQKINYNLELEIVGKALEAVDLKSSQDFFPGVKACNEFYQISVPEISEILQFVCKTHGLPLAVTWAICDWQGEAEHWQFSEKYDYCISTVDSACYVADSDLLGFHEACSEQYLFLDQGIVGKAFTTNKQWFATDITSFSKANYPLSHHARMFNLRAALAIPLRSIYTGLIEFVLELFFPRDCNDIKEQKQFWDMLSIIIQQTCKSFHVIMDKELDDKVSEQMEPSDGRQNKEKIQNLVSSPSNESQEESSWTPHERDTQKKDSFAFISWDCTKEEPEDEFNVITHWENNGTDLYQEQVFSDLGQVEQSSMLKPGVERAEDFSVGQRCSLSSKRAGEKRQTKIEKTITLQILRQYFAGSLKDAAKSIGVCPTTLKRICRQHGINRWPSRKIKKVNHSLRKLQLVVNSIHGAEGLIQMDSFCKGFQELSSPNFFGKDPLSSSKICENSKRLKPQPEGGLLSLRGTDSKSQSSSSSQNSGSAIYCSNEEKQLTTNNGLNTGSSLAIEDPILELRRTYSKAELYSLNQEEPKILRHLPKAPGHSLRDGVAFRVKATYGEENVRFGFLPNWGFKDLQQEIAKRFKIDDFSRIDLKYLDIDHEPVLLTCDADLEECIDLLSFSQCSTIKISLHEVSQSNLGRSFSSRGPF
ncbi:hypothetical protein P3X46_013710 [Hevea brasiliensis]|uniref:RWP-RK domain-containing protein n=1 Tax=Hevea brasiliensis TaxID=3981 RepID=A0ABQ9M5H3_HEVBR|nr:protein NLP2 [Hevea brasiliensis]XP_021656309.2 protein NLP2 [Hevea brasiliensis]XP_021656310.2 protein NLP2 [Hevea brasiliensis]KAJ9175128.1 hypothetical protein P3X46_013710 [Hevea brasiliensis]